MLKQFYSVVKATEAQQRFVLLTGVSKFSTVSVFSDLNNLTDLTMSRQAATLLGYTQEEVEANFPDYIERLATTQRMSVEETLEELRVWYNGYKFEEDAPSVYNPVSLMKCFMNEKFKNYWFETGTPTFLLDLLRRKPIDLGNLTAPEDSFSVYEVDAMLEHLKIFFHKVQYDLVDQNEKEKYYQTIFFTVFKLVGAMIDAEVKTSLGRIDAVVKTANHIYIFEFKLHGSAEDALRQIHEKQYAAGYRDDPRRKLLVGVEFSEKARNLGNWMVEEAK